MDIINNEKTEQIITEFSKTVQLFGLHPLEARLFSYLYLSGRALTLDEMSEALGKSKTSMSTNIRSLLDMNLVQRVWRKGVRKDLYKANSPLFKTFMNFYITEWVNAAKSQKETLEEIQIMIDKQNKEPSTDVKNVSNRLKEIIAFHSEIESLYERVDEK
ncbi:GbsR/MarR family transcriptional regulator [Oceanobacillus caeni]|uniref:GbsR/MarR family transcriptional regulator n=1 Tax=Oceanobacillus caeni TaxID=405946 RepID=UPI001C23344B|nr:MarR family transcriptional regulator [Oceanobacillus caeni]MBU8790378.1 transcriptional regulator [Oceanobacillus caeni]